MNCREPRSLIGQQMADNEMASYNKRAANSFKTHRLLIRRGKRFRVWRIVNGISQVTLAQQLEPAVHWKTIFNWEAGTKIPNKYLKQLVKKGWKKEEAFCLE